MQRGCWARPTGGRPAGGYMGKAIFAVLSLLALTGCATMTPQQQAEFQQQMAATQPRCATKRQCEAAWSAARNWVNTNCGMKIQTMTDSYIETYNSIDSDPSLACRVTKDPDSSGGYSLSITVSCANMFGCVPDAHQAALSFNREVSATTQQFAGG
jgi:hypothetical protein